MLIIHSKKTKVSDNNQQFIWQIFRQSVMSHSDALYAFTPLRLNVTILFSKQTYAWPMLRMVYTE